MNFHILSEYSLITQIWRICNNVKYTQLPGNILNCIGIEYTRIDHVTQFIRNRKSWWQYR